MIFEFYLRAIVIHHYRMQSTVTSRLILNLSHSAKLRQSFNETGADDAVFATTHSIDLENAETLRSEVELENFGTDESATLELSQVLK